MVRGAKSGDVNVFTTRAHTAARWCASRTQQLQGLPVLLSTPGRSDSEGKTSRVYRPRGSTQRTGFEQLGAGPGGPGGVLPRIRLRQLRSRHRRSVELAEVAPKEYLDLVIDGCSSSVRSSGYKRIQLRRELQVAGREQHPTATMRPPLPTPTSSTCGVSQDRLSCRVGS